MKFSQSVLREFLEYNAETGSLIYRPRDLKWFKSKRAWGVWTAKCSGKEAAFKTTNNLGYSRMVVCIDGKRYYAHRLIWIYMTGEDPIHIDHIDRDATNNRWSNLRRSDPSSNAVNKSLGRNNKSGHIGVSWAEGKKRWVARVKRNGKIINRYFVEKHQAIEKAKEFYTMLGFDIGHGSEKTYACV